MVVHRNIRKAMCNSPTQVIFLKLTEMVVDQLSNKKLCLWTEITVSAKNVVQRATSQNWFLPACLDKIKVPPPECSASRRWTTRHFPSCGSVATFITQSSCTWCSVFNLNSHGWCHTRILDPSPHHLSGTIPNCIPGIANGLWPIDLKYKCGYSIYSIMIHWLKCQIDHMYMYIYIYMYTCSTFY